MKKILAFSGSNSSTSINQRLINAVADLLEGNAQVEVIQLTQYEVPMYSIDSEKKNGIPSGVKEMKSKFETFEAYIISTPEHNSAMPAFFKNILDWLSRSGSKTMDGKPILLLSTSPGKGGAARALELVAKILPYEGGEIIGKFSFPSFNENFDTETNTIVNSKLKQEIESLLEKLY